MQRFWRHTPLDAIPLGNERFSSITDAIFVKSSRRIHTSNNSFYYFGYSHKLSILVLKIMTMVPIACHSTQHISLYAAALWVKFKFLRLALILHITSNTCTPSTFMTSLLLRYFPRSCSWFYCTFGMVWSSELRMQTILSCAYQFCGAVRHRQCSNIRM